MIVDLSCDFRWEAAHYLPLVPDGHQCKRMHGHSYLLTVTVECEVGEDGMGMDFAEIKTSVQPLINALDHRVLNDFIENPTSENICKHFWDILSYAIPVSSVTVSETGRSACTYRGCV